MRLRQFTVTMGDRTASGEDYDADDLAREVLASGLAADVLVTETAGTNGVRGPDAGALEASGPWNTGQLERALAAVRECA